ncbi:MAG: glucose-6-phosphate dehydrogenase assembly protein OpcA [Cellulomonadaceae bacterium]|jgi:glucose-6-phosphate dehydrogenase assembly protein OpcA|nr:glucose-6-phosphate dehydrogenase assembly protein OpcA [Cellulomonadaceae bacterium]
MIITMPDTTTSAVDKRLLTLREEGGAVALGRVLTLVVLAAEADVEAAVQATNDASNEHPCRVIVIATPTGIPDDDDFAADDGLPRLDAEIRVGGDAGASEVVILRASGPLRDQAPAIVTPLLLPDAPIVAWWPRLAPENPAADGVGRMAQRRITDSVAASSESMLDSLAANYLPGDTDLSWARATMWRGLLAAALDSPPFVPVTSIDVVGELGHTSIDMVAAWLALKLNCPVNARHDPSAKALSYLALRRTDADGGNADIVFDRPDGMTVTISTPGMPDRSISLPIRSVSDALAEELRRLTPDAVYAETLQQGLPLLTHK